MKDRIINLIEAVSDLKYRTILWAVFISVILIVGGFVFHGLRSSVELNQASAAHVKASGKCAGCHNRETSAIVRQYEKSKHAKKKVSCLDCHQALDKQEKQEHKGFTIAKSLTSKNCNQCHTTEHAQYMRSRHAAPAWAAVRGAQDFTKEQIAFAERFHKGAVKRPANKLALKEGNSAIVSGCVKCHQIGKPHKDGSIGQCTECHSRHNVSVAIARNPATCGQCHMGPDHSQIEIYNESKHGILYAANRKDYNLDAPPKRLTTADMPVPTCATCHMSGIEGGKVTHDTTERLSYWLFAAISKKRPTFETGQINMKETCLKCHATKHVETFYKEATQVVVDTNKKMLEIQAILTDLKKRGLITPEPFDHEIDFLIFDFWHYFGRTAKHGAFMGGADFVQWHGNYELLHLKTKIQAIAKEMKSGRKR